MTLVVGATGLLGRRICEELRARGVAVRALVRPAGDAHRHVNGVAIVNGDLKEPASLAAACRGVDTVVTTANAMATRRSGDSLATVDLDGSLALVAAARSAGVRRFVYTSASPVLPADNPLIRYKRIVEQAVRTSGMAWTILQPSAFMEVHAGPPAGWDFVRGRARIMGSGRVPVSYISVIDVARFAAVAVDHAAAINRDLRMTGPEPLTPFDAVAIAERVTGRRFRVQRLPSPALSVLAVLARPFNDALSSLFRIGIALDNGDVVDMTSLQREFSIAQTTFADYVRREVAQVRPAEAS